MNTPHPYDLIIGLDRSDRKADLCLIDTHTGQRRAAVMDIIEVAKSRRMSMGFMVFSERRNSHTPDQETLTAKRNCDGHPALCAVILLAAVFISILNAHKHTLSVRARHPNYPPIEGRTKIARTTKAANAPTPNHKPSRLLSGCRFLSTKDKISDANTDRANPTKISVPTHAGAVMRNRNHTRNTHASTPAIVEPRRI
jgi:hypothetical protein